MAAHSDRQAWIGALARSGAPEIEELLSQAGALSPHIRLRGPEIGLAMVRGRIGGGGAPFNLGEMTVTRCTVRDAAGRVGHAVVAGRDVRHAELAASVDAALQDPERTDALREAVLDPLLARQRMAAEIKAARAAATRVEFFTMSTMRS